jgi:hypothetical protein
MAKVEVRRREAVELLRALGLFKSDSWPPDKLRDYLLRIEEVGDLDDVTDPLLRNLYKRMKLACSAHDEVIVDSGAGKPPRKEPIKPIGLPAPVIPKHKRIKPEKPTVKKPGVVSVIINMLLAANEQQPTSKPLIYEELVRRFGPGTEYNRSVNGMMNTLSGLGTWILRPEHARRGIKLHHNSQGWWATIELQE